MNLTPYRGVRFPKAIIEYAIWLYLRFMLSLRDVEELLAERGIVVTYETVRVWVSRFGPLIAWRLRRRRGPPSNHWHLDEMFVKIAGRTMYLWRAVDSEGEILDMLVQSRRDKRAALRLLRKLLKKQSIAPEALVTDGLRAYGAAARELGLTAEHIQAKRKRQSGGELARPDPATREENAGDSLLRFGPTLPRCPRRCRQDLHDLPPSHFRRVSDRPVL